MVGLDVAVAGQNGLEGLQGQVVVQLLGLLIVTQAEEGYDL